MNIVLDKVLNKIKRRRRGWVFMPTDFRGICSPRKASYILSRLVKGTIRRASKGIYYYPKYNKIIGMLSPTSDALAELLASKSGEIIFVTGAKAANMLHYSTQVPARISYLTSGRSRVVRIGHREITFMHARVPIIKRAHFIVNLVIQGLYNWVGLHKRVKSFVHRPGSA